MYTHLFSEISIDSQNIKNRIMMSQSVTGLAKNNSITEQMIAYYAERAMGGAGLIEMEPALIEDPEAEGFPNMLSLCAKDSAHK
ncbi:MAG: hypothetical protein ACM3TR_08115 [Caulobacteraceae bacterium]